LVADDLNGQWNCVAAADASQDYLDVLRLRRDVLIDGSKVGLRLHEREFPPGVRGTAVGTSYNIGRVGSTISPILIGRGATDYSIGLGVRSVDMSDHSEARQVLVDRGVESRAGRLQSLAWPPRRETHERWTAGLNKRDEIVFPDALLENKEDGRTLTTVGHQVGSPGPD
jgi:hypothetical protein